MPSKNIEQLLDNEREWRRYMIEQIDEIKKENASMKAWNLVFRVVGGALFTLVLALIQMGR